MPVILLAVFVGFGVLWGKLRPAAASWPFEGEGTISLSRSEARYASSLPYLGGQDNK